jgi:hypothetical protein
MTAGSSSEEWKGVFNLYLTGRLQGDRFRVELKQQDTQGKIGFDWGINVVLGDTATTLRFFPTNPILGYNRWTLNPDNRLVIWPEGKLWSNLKMEGRGKWIRFQSLGDQDHLKNRLQVQMAGIDLAALSERTPFVPQLSGILGMNLLLYHRQQEVGMHGNLQVADLEYEQFRMGDVDLKLDYHAADTFANHALQAELMLDSIRRIWTRGTLETKAGEQKLDLAVEIPSLPLALANAFVPQDMMQLGGEIVGKSAVLAEGDAAKRDDLIFLEKLPLFDGEGNEI